MKKTIIHVGLHKTATTFLQNNVWPTIQGYTYLSRPYTQHNYAFNQMQYADESLYKKDYILKELEYIGSTRLLLSDEAFSGKPVYFSYLNRAIIARRLQEVFPEAEIVLFLRDQKDIMLSHYSSYIKMPYGTKIIEKFFYKPQTNYTYSEYSKEPSKCNISNLYYNTNDYFIHLDCFKYSPLVELYKRLFEKCHVFLYEEFKQHKKDAFAKLGEIVEQHISIKSSAYENISLTDSELARRRILNKISSCTNHKYMKKLARIALNITPTVQAQDNQAILKHMAEGYYTKDNAILKSLLPCLPWNKHTSKYA